MKKISIILATTLSFLLFACTKDKDGYGDKNYYGSFSAELLGLPGAATLDVYVDNIRIDSLRAGQTIGIASLLVLPARTPVSISFKKAGTDSTVVDTTVTVNNKEKANLKIAYSSLLGIQSFTSGSDASVGADSTSFFLFSQLPEDLIPDDVTVDAYLFKANADGTYSETGNVWTHLERNKLHPFMATIRSTANADGTTNSYVIRLKNAVTGDFIKDGWGRDYISPYFEGGSREIVSLTATQLFGMYLFQAQYVIY